MPLLVFVVFLWELPAALLVWLFYLIPFYFLGGLRFYGWRYYEHWLPFAVFSTGKPTDDVNDRGLDDSKSYAAAWRNWGGHALPFAIVVTNPYNRSTIKHESRHELQWAILGCFFPIVYLLFLIDGYRNNLLEVDAYGYEARR